ncbi:MAG: crossover junction endodeoxyribonuclease RuvC [Microbacterium sp.]
MASSLRVLGIDPGLTRCGVGVVDVARDRSARLVHVGVVRSSAAQPVSERLAAIAAGLRAVIAEHGPAVVAVERVFAQQNRHTVMGTAQASGVALLVAAEHGLPAATHTPTEVKAAITGYGSAEKLQVQAMVARILRLDVLPQPADAADALAIALCHAWRRGVPSADGPSADGPSADGPSADGPSAEGSSAGDPRAVLTPAQRAWADAERGARR